MPALAPELFCYVPLQKFDMASLDLSFVPRGRVKTLARYATTALVHNSRQLDFAHTYEASVTYNDTWRDR